MILGMIILKTYNDSVSHHELLTQYEHINNIYNGHMELLLWIFGIGITLAIGLLPILAYKQLKNAEDKILFQMEKNENKLNIEIEKIRKENKEFQDGIDDRAGEIIDLKVSELKTIIEELNIKYEKDSNIKFENMSYIIYYSSFFGQGLSMAFIKQYNTAVSSFLESTIYGIYLDSTDKLIPIKNNLNKIKKEEATISEHDIEINKKFTFKQFKKEVLFLTEDKSEMAEVVKEILYSVESMFGTNKNVK